jgi:hypothetical protein
MVDEVEIVRRALGNPAPDPQARERARVRLREAMVLEQQMGVVRHERRPLVRPLRWLGAAAAIVAAVLVVQTVLPPHGGGPSTSAASELRQLASVASSSTAFEIPDGLFLYMSREVSALDSGERLETGRSYDYYVKSTVETWTAPDGSETRTTTTHSVTFATDQDRNTWIAAGSPSLSRPGTHVEQFKTGELTNYWISDLPTDPEELGTLIRSGGVILRDSTDLDVLSVVGTLLASAPASPELRASLFQVAADLPSVEYLGSVQDPLGRSGVGVQLVVGPNAFELIFDPSTSELLAKVTVPAAGGAPLSSQAYTSSGIVDQVGVKA